MSVRYRIGLWLFVSIFLFLLGYIVLRASKLAFTHDESNTYTIINPSVKWTPYTYTANNHLLNTWLMRQMMRITGSSSELTLRFPNVLAFLVYGLAVWLLLRRRQNEIFLFLFGLSLMLLNPYLIEFFSLARGYGLAMGFGLLAVAFYLKDIDVRNIKSSAQNFFFSMLFSLLAAYSNFILINLNIALLLFFLLKFLRLRFPEPSKDNIPVYIGLVLVLALDIYYIRDIYNQLLVLQENKELYFGGQQGFIVSTLRVLIHRSIYLSYYGEVFWQRIYYGLLVVFFGLLIILLLRKKQTKLNHVFALLVTMIAAAILQFFLFQIPYPTDRTALFFIPLAGLSLFHLGVDVHDWISTRFRKTARLFGMVLFIFFALPLGYHFIKNINTTYVIEWKRDAHTKNAIENILKSNNAGSPVKVVSNWYLAASLNYYAEKLPGDMEVIIDDDFNASGDFIYCYTEDLEKISNIDLYEIHSDFRDTQTVLLLKKH
ncbi:MAG TPA: hypothetical protein PKE03_12735 [Bacteroidales bacterium]|nr:hypothetical protein [Bacteroidales bacterium]